MQEGKLEDPAKEILQKQAWTGNQTYKSVRTEDRTHDSLVQSEGRYTTLPCFPQMQVIGSDDEQQLH